MAWKECVICGAGFETNYKRKKTCGNECSAKNTRNKTAEWAKSNTQKIRAHDKKYKEKNKDYYSKYRKENSEYYRRYGKEWRLKNIEDYTMNSVRFGLRRTLNAEPPADLVEEATALRLLKRAMCENSP